MEPAIRTATIRARKPIPMASTIAASSRTSIADRRLVTRWRWRHEAITCPDYGCGVTRDAGAPRGGCAGQTDDRPGAAGPMGSRARQDAHLLGPQRAGCARAVSVAAESHLATPEP